MQERRMMSRTSQRCVLLLAFLVPVLLGEAPPELANRTTIPLGRPARSAVIAVTRAEGGAQVEAEGVKRTLQIDDPQRSELQAVTLATGAGVAVVRVFGAKDREAAALLTRNANGKVEVLWSGALDMRGDAGERQSDGLVVLDRTGVGRKDLLVGRYSESVKLCGQERTLLDPRSVDPVSLKLRPIALSRLTPTAETPVEVSAAADSPGPKGPPLLKRSLRLVGVSSELGSVSMATPSAPMQGALTDGDPATFWKEGNSAGGLGEFATFRWQGADAAIRAFAVIPSPLGAGDGQPLAIARSLWLVGDAGARIKVRLPNAPEPGRRYWVVPPAPLTWHCISVVFDETTATQHRQTGPAVLAELEVYTDYDFGDGVAQLIRELSVDGPTASNAATLLATLRPNMAPALLQNWPTLGAAGRRRSIHVLAGNAEHDSTAREALALALDDADGAVHDAAFVALLEAGPAARAVLAQRVALGGEKGDVAAIALARRAPAEVIGTLLDALGHEGGEARPGLREALTLACRSHEATVLTAMRTWLDGSTATVGGRSSLALALAHAANNPASQALAIDSIAKAAPTAAEFEDLWRLVKASRVLPSEAGTDAWLAVLATHDTRWMLRAEAIDALVERKSQATAEVAQKALDDAYPRVRIAAARALAASPSAMSVLAKRATRDRWTSVRATALEAIAGQPGAEPVLLAGLADSAHQARAAAVRSLAKARIRSAWPLVKQRIEDHAEAADVLAEGVAYARGLCIVDAAQALASLLRRGAGVDATSRDADVGMLALEAMLDLGGQSAQLALSIARASTTLPGFQASAEKLASRPPSCARSTQLVPESGNSSANSGT